MYNRIKARFNKQSESDVTANHTGQVDQEPFKTAPNTGIRYKEDLINKYKSEHQELLSLYGMINDLYKAGSYAEASKKLSEMRKALPAHILDEELNFYIYLTHCYHSEKDTQDIMMKQKKEVKVIGLSAIDFLKKYSDMGVNISDDPDFENEFAALGQTLTKRIIMEENELYPLYCAPE